MDIGQDARKWWTFRCIIVTVIMNVWDTENGVLDRGRMFPPGKVVFFVLDFGNFGLAE